MTEREIRRSDDQYTPIASAYVTSAIHAQGADLTRLVEIAALPDGATVLDVGTGTGHTALAFAASGADVLGLDMTAAMLRQAYGLVAERDLSFMGVLGYAEALPFIDASFDAVVCRYCAHHFNDISKSVHEMARVLKRGGQLLFVDHMAPDDDVADEFVNRLDWLRDPSHNREPRLSEYHDWYADAELTIDIVEPFREVIVCDQWFARAQTAPEREAQAREMLTNANEYLRETFAIRDEPQSFELHMVLLRAIKDA